MLRTELATAEIPELYQRFAHIVGDQHWKRRVSALKTEAKGNRFLTNYLQAENAITFELERCRKLVARYGALPPSEAENEHLFSALSFAAQVLSIMEISSPQEAERLRRRIHGALNKPDDMRALQLELSAATHFVRRGHKVGWPEMSDHGRYDLLVESIGNDGLEIECKSISEDKGRKVHRRDALVFHSLLWSYLTPVCKDLTAGLSVALTVPKRLPTEYKDRVTLAKRVSNQILIGCSATLEDGTDIRVSDFDATSLGNLANPGRPEIIRTVVENATATRNREAMVLGSRSGGALVFAVQSAVSDSLTDAMLDTLKTAAKKQVTGTRPAVFLAGFHGLDGEQLLSIADQDNGAVQQPTLLRIGASRFLSGSGRGHVVGVAFISRSALIPACDGIVDSGGTAYYFPKRDSTFWHDDFSGLF